MRFSTITMAALASQTLAQEMMTICDKYTAALLNESTPANQYAVLTLLVKTVVLGNFTGEGTANPTLPGSLNDVPGILAEGMVDGETVNLAPYFDGTLASSNRGDMAVSVNFLDGGSSDDPMALGADGSNQATLLANLISYFGVLLGCSGVGMDGFPAYAGSNSQYNVHKYMALSLAEFNYFVSQVGAAATSFGVTMDDVTTAAGALNGLFGARCAMAVPVIPDTTPEPQVICIDSSCPIATTSVMPGCASDAAVSGFTATEPMTASMTGSMTASMTESMATSMPASMTESMGSMTGSMMPTGSAASETPTPDAAPRQTAAAGVMAAAGLIAAALL